MSVIYTRYLPATNTRSARVKATIDKGWGNGSLTVAYDFAMTGGENHRAAAIALAKKLNIPAGKWYAVLVNNGFIFSRADTTGVGFFTHPQIA